MELYVSISDFLRFFRRKRVAFLIVVLLFGIVCGLAPLELAKYSYSANTTILINSKIPESADINANLQLPSIMNNRIQTAVAEAASNHLLEKTAARLGIDKDEIGKITGEQVKSSLAVKVTVQTANSGLAAQISDTAAQVLGEEIQKQFPSPKLSVTVTEKAIPSKPQGRKSAMVKTGLLGLILGFIVFVCYGIVRVLCDHTIRAGAAAEETLSTKFLGNIPHERRGAEREDAVRRTRSVLFHSCKGAKNYLVAGIRKSGCGAETAASLAVAFAQSGKKTLLIDADLRNPQLKDRFSAKPEKTLGDVLSGSCGVADAVVPVPTQSGLSLLTAASDGKLNPSDLLAEGFDRVLSQAGEGYDFVVVCAPSELDFPDAESMAPSVQAVVLAAQYGVTTYNDLRGALHNMKETGGQVAGFVVADV